MKLRSALLASLAGWAACSQDLTTAPPIPDLASSVCVPDRDCMLVDHPCHIGLQQCDARSTCLDSGAHRPNKTPCGETLVCSDGNCLGPCKAGVSCMPLDRCHQGVTTCDTGTVQCKDTRQPIAGNPRCGLLGYWPFDGDGADHSGGLRPLVLVGAPGFASGVLGQALDLHGDGRTYAIRPVDDEAFDFGASDFSIQVWVRYNTTLKEQIAIEKFSGESGPGWTLTKVVGNALLFYAQPTLMLNTRALAIPAGVWHHYLMRRTNLVFELFVDGIKQGSANDNNRVPDTTAPLLVGRRNSSQVLALDGQVDEVAIWGRYLSDSEVVILYNEGRGLSLE